MHVISTLELGPSGLPNIHNASRREELLTRLDLHLLGQASMSDTELMIAESLRPVPELPTTITEARRNQLIVEAMML